MGTRVTSIAQTDNKATTAAADGWSIGGDNTRLGTSDINAGGAVTITDGGMTSRALDAGERMMTANADAMKAIYMQAIGAQTDAMRHNQALTAKMNNDSVALMSMAKSPDAGYSERMTKTLMIGGGVALVVVVYLSTRKK